MSEEKSPQDWIRQIDSIYALIRHGNPPKEFMEAYKKRMSDLIISERDRFEELLGPSSKDYKPEIWGPAKEMFEKQLADLNNPDELKNMIIVWANEKSERDIIISIGEMIGSPEHIRSSEERLNEDMQRAGEALSVILDTGEPTKIGTNEDTLLESRISRGHNRGNGTPR